MKLNTKLIASVVNVKSWPFLHRFVSLTERPLSIGPAAPHHPLPDGGQYREEIWQYLRPWT